MVYYSFQSFLYIAKSPFFGRRSREKFSEFSIVFSLFPLEGFIILIWKDNLQEDTTEYQFEIFISKRRNEDFTNIHLFDCYGGV